jgi:hypothetical protein
MLDKSAWGVTIHIEGKLLGASQYDAAFASGARLCIEPDVADRGDSRGATVFEESAQ